MDQPVRKSIPNNFAPFLQAYVDFATKDNKTSRQYIPVDTNRTVLRSILELYGYYHQNSEIKQDDAILAKLTDTIALKLFSVEKDVQQKIAQLTNVQRGSIVQAMVKENIDASTYKYVIAKVEHSEWIDSETFEMNLGFPEKNKKVWKSAVFTIQDGDIGPFFTEIDVYVDNHAKYWADDFLELKEARTDGDNTKRVLYVFEKALKPVKAESLGDYYYLRNTVVHELQTSKMINFPDMVNDLLENYHPSVDTIDTKKIKENLLKDGEKGNFDTQFHSDPDSIKKNGKIKISISPAIDLEIKQGLPNWKESFKVHKDPNGLSYVMIKCDDEETLSMFANDDVD